MLDYYLYKNVLDLFKQGRLEDAKSVLMELQAKHIALADENSILKAQLQEYEDILYISKNLIFDGSCYWLMTGSIKQGPFCEKCYSGAGILIRLIDGKRGMRCPMCGEVHRSAEETVAAPRRAVSGSGKILPFAR
ncbi:MAG: hypothetical protein IJD04_00535 [Desulfovibrionaceae bacterium]|nr:hypothetical protein [Desulfovibrionaceae bacterium]